MIYRTSAEVTNDVKMTSSFNIFNGETHTRCQKISHKNLVKVGKFQLQWLNRSKDTKCIIP